MHYYEHLLIQFNSRLEQQKLASDVVKLEEEMEQELKQEQEQEVEVEQEQHNEQHNGEGWPMEQRSVH